MDMLRSMQEALDFVERNLQERIGVEEVAGAAMMSKYHFQRMFHMLTGFTVSVYIRNRRLTRAAEALAASDEVKVIDLALSYGYDSPEAFAKAFQRMHGVTPSSARSRNVKLKSYPRLSFHIQLKGDVEMNYRIVEAEASVAAGKETLVVSDPYKEIPVFVEQIWEDGTHDQINQALGREPRSLLSGYHYDFTEDGSRLYLMGEAIAEVAELPTGLTVLSIPAQTYAVFEGHEVAELWMRIYSEWFPSAGFEQAEGPCIEKYTWIDADCEKALCEVWIPVMKKER
ncbi:hypothetical protein PA598K_03793 [Paenibacillus sp. 598K]|nr:hypothetical protein PA598K_03793 [Paenibacillus sp. 598K]